MFKLVVVRGNDEPVRNEEVRLDGGVVTTNEQGLVLVDLPGGRHNVAYGNTSADFTIGEDGEFKFKVG